IAVQRMSIGNEIDAWRQDSRDTASSKQLTLAQPRRLLGEIPRLQKHLATLARVEPSTNRYVEVQAKDRHCDFQPGQLLSSGRLTNPCRQSGRAGAANKVPKPGGIHPRVLQQ